MPGSSDGVYIYPFVARKTLEEAYEDESDDEGSDDGQYLNLNDEEGQCPTYRF
jgi:hypothetical protein